MKLELTQGTQVTLGIDTGMRYHDVAVLVKEELVGQVHIEASVEAWDALLLRFAGCEIRAVYEAGPDGYWLWRYLRGRGVTCKVVAPTMVPVEPGMRRRKNNKRDARRLGELYRQLRAVTVPTEEQEADRQLVRVREQLVEQRSRLQAEILSLLRFAGRPLRKTEETAQNWGPRRLKYLEGLVLDGPVRAKALRLLVGSLRDVIGRIKEAESAIGLLTQGDRYRNAVERLTKIKGVSLITAVTFMVEIFVPERFPSQAELAAYLGFVPRENSTGENDCRGRILASGNKHLRRVLIQSAWIWQRYDVMAKSCLQRFYRNHGNQKGVKQKSVVYLARKLASILWAMWRDGTEYNPLGNPKRPLAVVQKIPA